MQQRERRLQLLKLGRDFRFADEIAELLEHDLHELRLLFRELPQLGVRRLQPLGLNEERRATR